MTQTITYSQVDELPPKLRQAILRWTLAIADTKHRLGIQFSHWVTGTPALEAAVGSAAITQDELGHARSLYGLLRHFPDAPEHLGAENDLEARTIFYNPAVLMPKWDSWLKVVAVNVLLDRALQVSIAAMKEASFRPLAGRVGKIVQEERFHRIFGDQWLARLAKREDEVTEELQQAINWAWQITLEWLGPDDDATSALLLTNQVLKHDIATIRQRWLDDVMPLLSRNQLTVPEIKPDWSRWDPQFRHVRF